MLRLLLLGAGCFENQNSILTKNHETNQLFLVVNLSTKTLQRRRVEKKKNSRNSNTSKAARTRTSLTRLNISTVPETVKALRSRPRVPSTTAWPSTKKCSRHPCPFRKQAETWTMIFVKNDRDVKVGFSLVGLFQLIDRALTLELE